MDEEPNVLLVDTNEPLEALNLLSPVVPVQRATLNEYGYADYKWNSVSGKVTQVERKTWGELLADIDKVEDQLRRHLTNQPQCRLLFMLEGMVDSDSAGTYTITQRKTIWTRGYRSGTTLNRVYSWLYNVSDFVEVYQTGNFEASCVFLAAAFKQDQKVEHTIFHRYFKKVSFHPLPQVTMLMGMVPNLGEKRAEALVAQFSTVWNVVNASPNELQVVPGIGPTLALSILRRVGRLDV